MDLYFKFKNQIRRTTTRDIAFLNIYAMYSTDDSWRNYCKAQFFLNEGDIDKINIDDLKATYERIRNNKDSMRQIEKYLETASIFKQCTLTKWHWITGDYAEMMGKRFIEKYDL